MPGLTSIYTKSGDSGRTQLSDGMRVSQDSVGTEIPGALDELNPALGVAAASGLPTELVQPVSRVQNEFFNLGAELSFGQPLEPTSGMPLVQDKLSDALFRWARLANPAHHQPETLWEPAQY